MWLAKLFIHPRAPVCLGDFYNRLAVGDLFPPWFVISTAAVFLGVATLLALLTPSEEVLERWTLQRHAELFAEVAGERAQASDQRQADETRPRARA